MQVELAHGGRGPSSSDRRGGYSGGGGGSGGARFGISRHSEYRGTLTRGKFFSQKGLGERDWIIMRLIYISLFIDKKIMCLRLCINIYFF